MSTVPFLPFEEANRHTGAERFVAWLRARVEEDAIGRLANALTVDPTGRFWLGRLAPRDEIANSPLGDRAERLEPCEVGIRLKLPAGAARSFEYEVECVAWRGQNGAWTKTQPIVWTGGLDIPEESGSSMHDEAGLSGAIAAAGAPGVKGAIEIDVGTAQDGSSEVTIGLVNTSPENEVLYRQFANARLFECRLTIKGLQTEDFILESLPDSFRYDRRVPAWGVNCGVVRVDGGFATDDLPSHSRRRPLYWAVGEKMPDMRFDTLSLDALTSSKALLGALSRWGEKAWDKEAIESKSGAGWSAGMIAEALSEREAFLAEVGRVESGIASLEGDAHLRAAFEGMNAAMAIASKGKPYDAWRPFQLGFLLANLSAVIGGADDDVVDIVWFATGGGKTETYLGLIVTAALYDRMRGKSTGVTAWSRFPLRMLSLQQTQRFADALAAAEIVRRRMKLGGDAFGLGFLVGGDATPNELKVRLPKDGGKQWDVNDASMPDRLKLLKRCPFCRLESIVMKFNRRFWRLEHNCSNEACDWGPKEPLPVWVVDTDVWRHLPTVIVGTLDKAAGIAMQASMRGIVGAPSGFCSEAGHGHTYAKRSTRPTGCLVPDCKGKRNALPMKGELYGPRLRLQDELHLLQDSLGAVDAHYEAVLDALQSELCGSAPKIVASSATLSGYRRQADVLYRREARVFPQPEPVAGDGFWTKDSTAIMRTYCAIAPRGQTIEYAVDRLIVSLQTAVRRLRTEPGAICDELGLDPAFAPFLLDIYGTDVVYGNTLRDLDAVMRSGETQWGEIEGEVKIAQLTGRTDFGEISETLDRLEKPEREFSERLHVVPASSMMSHGVDIDRLNVMVMLGLPLTTAEFIQASARVGRRWPALVLVVHKIGRERDASVYRAFGQFVAQGDRFVEPIPITRRSRRVLDRTLPGLAFARLLMLEEPQAAVALTTIPNLRRHVRTKSTFAADEVRAVTEMLELEEGVDEALRGDVEDWYRIFMRNLEDPPDGVEWPNELGPRNSPMMSLRDVEEQVEVRGRDFE